MITFRVFIVRDADGQQLAYVDYETEPGRRAAAKLLTKDEARRIAQRREADAYGSNCNVKLTALHRLKPSSNAKSHEGSITAWFALLFAGAYVRSKRGAINPHTARIMIAPTIAPMKPAFSPG